jgi:predicted enzyme related to lactoylglutathione lyase
MRQRVEGAGGEARSAKELGGDGCYYMLFKDPDGNRFSVYEKSGR